MSKIQLSSDIVNDKFTEFLYHAYDIQNKEKTITEIPIPNDDDMKIIMNDDNFNIFLICGRSGSGNRQFYSLLNMDHCKCHHMIMKMRNKPISKIIRRRSLRLVEWSRSVFSANMVKETKSIIKWRKGKVRCVQVNV